MKRAARSGLGFLERVVRQKMGDRGDEAGGAQRFLDIVAFEVDVRIDFVGDAVVALVALESDIVRRGAHPKGPAAHQEWRFPNAQMIARTDDGDGFGMGPAIILRTAKEVKLAHGHRQIGVFRDAVENAVENGVFHVGVNLDPSGGREDTLHGGFRAEDEEIHHVAGIAFFVADAAGNLGEELIVDAGKGSDLAGDDNGGAGIRGIDLNANDIRPVAGIVGALVDAKGKPAGSGNKYVLARADQEGLGSVRFADAADECAAACSVQRKNADQILEAAAQTFRAIVIFGVAVSEASRGSNQDVLASLNIDAAIEPGLVAGELNFLG